MNWAVDNHYGKHVEIDEGLNVVVSCTYDSICDIDKNGLFLVEVNDLYGLVDCNGVEVTPVGHNKIEMENDVYVVK